ncbi:MAG: hypothetical protein OET90_04340 [Desulfuromonadales bacterium]|nr:hypothetical protein [Desulfuromonadales bacterium]
MQLQTDSTYPELLADLAVKLNEYLIEQGLETQQAQDIAWRAAEMVRCDWAGQDLYIPKGKRFEQLQRDAEIYRRFTGSNHLALAREYGISQRQIYSVIKRVRLAQQERGRSGLLAAHGAER